MLEVSKDFKAAKDQYNQFFLMELKENDGSVVKNLP